MKYLVLEVGTYFYIKKYNDDAFAQKAFGFCVKLQAKKQIVVLATVARTTSIPERRIKQIDLIDSISHIPSTKIITVKGISRLTEEDSEWVTE